MKNNKRGYALLFLRKLKKLLNQIQNSPEAFAVRYKNIHMAFTNRFPFGIHYKIEEDKIIVLAVLLHTSKNPENWKNLGQD